MSISKDTTGVAPEDVEAHRVARAPMDVSQATTRHDTGDDVEAHSCRYNAEQGDGGGDVEGHRYSGV